MLRLCCDSSVVEEDDGNDTDHRKERLKDAVLCLACIKFLSIFLYIGMLTMVSCYSVGRMSDAIRVMLIVAVVPECILAAVLFFGAIKASVAYYTLIFLLVYWYWSGTWSAVLQALTLIAIPLQVINSIVLFYGALEERPWALDFAIWLCLAVAAYNTVLGIMGFIYFLRHGKETVHFVIAAFFFVLAISLFTVVFHDIVIIHTLKKTVAFATPLQEFEHEEEEKS